MQLIKILVKITKEVNYMKTITQLADDYDSSKSRSEEIKAKLILDEIAKKTEYDYREIEYLKGKSNYEVLNFAKYMALEDEKLLKMFTEVASMNDFSMLYYIDALVSLYTSEKTNFEYIKQKYIERGLIESFEVDDKNWVRLISKYIGTIIFKKLSDFHKDPEVKKSILENIGQGCCFKYAESVIRNNPMANHAVTAFCNGMFSNLPYPHAFAVDTNNNVIDLAKNLTMSKKDYYKLYRVREMAVVKKGEIDTINAESMRYDETTSDLFPLIRIGWYKYKGLNNDEKPI